MRNRLVLAMLAFVAFAVPAQAGAYADALSKCLIKSASDTDKTTLVVWIFTAMAMHPAVKSYTQISAAQRDAINAGAGALFQRLITVDCRAETVAAMKNEGDSALESGFEALGEEASRGLMSDPQVSDALTSELSKHVDLSELGKVFVEGSGKP